jgi:hypothetical protein
MRKITIAIFDRKHDYRENIEGNDYDALFNDFKECQDNGANPILEKMTFEEWTQPLVQIKWCNERLARLNGKHFIFGWLECFAQSDKMTDWMRESKCLLVRTWRTPSCSCNKHKENK